MSIDLTKLVAQGRAYSVTRPWNPEELDALLALERERGVGRLKAAEYIRNGILTLEDYDRAVEAEFVPKTAADIEAQVEESLKDHPFATDTEKAAKKAAKEAEKAAKKAAKEAEDASGEKDKEESPEESNSE